MASYNLVNGRPATVDPDLGDAGPRLDATTRCSTSATPARPYNLTGSRALLRDPARGDAAVLKAGLDSFTIDDANGAPTAAAIHRRSTRACSPSTTSTRRPGTR